MSPVVACAHAFRRGEVATASEGLLALIDELETILSNTGIPAPMREGLAELLHHLLEAQNGGDYLLVADLLEHELALHVG